MLRNKRIISLFLSLVLVLGIVFGMVPEQSFADDTVSLKILHTNDIHGRFEYKDAADREPSIGFAKLKTKIDQVRAANSNVLLLDGGDTTHGTVDINLTEGKAMIDFMNAVGYDAMVSGNHDFNYGYERLLKLRDLADFPVLAANVKKEDGSMDFESYKIQEMNGIKVGMFGLATEETKYKSSPTNTEGIDFTSYMDASRKAVEYFKKQDVDLIVAITHIGIDVETDVTTEDIAKEVDGIDVIIDGHSHTELPEGLVVNNTLIAQTGSYLKNLGMVDIEFKGGKVISKKASLFTTEQAKDIAEDPDMKAEIDAMLSSNEKVKKQVIGKSKVDLDGERDIVRKEESTLGNVITDAMLKSSGADVALTNGGGIRATIEKGDITLGGVMNAFPFTNFLRTIEVTGAEILQALEHGVDSYPGTAGKFPHVAGMKYVFDPDQTPGYRVTEVKIDGEDMDLKANYSLVTNDFMAIGGDGYTMFEGKKIIAEGALLSDVLVEYLETEGTINPSIEGRITTSKSPDKPYTERLSGKDRVETAIKVSQKAFKDGSSDNVVLVGYTGEVDALAGTLLASHKNAPILLTKKDKVSDDVKAEIKRLGAKNVYVLGGEDVLAPAIETQLKALDLTVKRLGGENRFDTAVLVAKEVKGAKADKVFLASGENTRLADALAIAPVSARENAPVLLVKNSKMIPKTTIDAIKAMGVKEIEFVGGETAINDSIKTEFKGIKFDRVAGDNRENTAVAIAEKYFKDSNKAIVTYGWKYADALVAGYLGKLENAPILLTNTDKITEETLGLLKGSIDLAYVLGGAKVVSTPVVNKISEAISSLSEYMTITLISTTDMHGRMYTTNALTETDVHNSLPKVATVVKNERTANPNTIMIDNGDTIQGTAETSYFITQKPYEINPMMHAMRLVGYDGWILGNHEFNYPWPIMKTTYNYIQSDSIEEGSPVEIINANLIVKDKDALKEVDGDDALTKKVGDPYFSPYMIKEFKTDDNKIVKVGILGLNNPNVPQWDVPSNFPGLIFGDLENTDTKLAFEVNKWVPKMKEDGADVIIVSTHSGTEKDLQSSSNENQVRDMIANSSGVDLVVAGHDHREYIETQANKDGKEIQIINGGGKSVAKANIKVDIKGINKNISAIDTSMIKLDDTIEADSSVIAAMKPYYEEAVEYVNKPLGQIEGEWEKVDREVHIVTQTNTMDLVHRAQIDATKNSSKGPALVSLTAPAIDWSYGPEEGLISLKDIYRLYRYDNTLYMVEMTGAQLKSWMSRVADKYVIEEGEARRDNPESIFGVDTFYGVNYEYFIGEEKGNRLGKVTLKDGREVTDNMIIPVALNNYRLSGEYGFKDATGVTEADAVWSSVKDLGNEKGQVRILIADFIEKEKVVKPVHDTNWKINVEKK